MASNDVTRNPRRFWVGGLGVLLAGLVVLPLIISESLTFLMNDFLIMALYAMSYNLLFGRTGMLSFGHAAFYGSGAYTVALLYAHLKIDLIPAIFFAPLVAGLVALIIGFFVVRLTGFYFAITSMAFAQLVYTIVYEWYAFTGGDNGVHVVPPDYLFSTINYYYFSLGVVVVCIALLHMITVSPFGAALGGIRENPERVAFVGINVRAYQLAAFVIAGAFAGVAGALRAPMQQMAFPNLLFWTSSADPLVMCLAGGFFTFFGPIIGTAFFVFVNFYFASQTEYALLIMGVLITLIVLFMPGGVVGFVENLHLFDRRRKPDR